MSDEIKNNENEFSENTVGQYSNFSSERIESTAIDQHEPNDTTAQQYQSYQNTANTPTQNNLYHTDYYSTQNTSNQTNTMYSSPANSYGYGNYSYAQPVQKVKKQKRKYGSGIVFCCIVLSILCGFAGAFGGMYVYNRLIPKNANTNTTNAGGSTVVYQASENDIPESVAQAGTVASVAKTALPSVVEIRTEAVVNNSFYGQYVTEGAGSGVIISKDGYIVTNNHVVSGSSNIKVRLSNGDEYTAKLIGTDSQTDIAVIKIDANNLQPAVFGDSSKLIIGEITVAIGNPLGELGGTVTDGIISALDREITVEGENMVLLQTNAAVSPGNSGGGLFDSNGYLIGIVNAKSSGSDIEGLGFAIPINTAKPIIEDLIEKGHVTGRPSIGITIVDVTTDYQRFMYGVSDFGVYIQNAISEEFKSGDRIIAIDGNSVSVSSDIKSVLNGHKVGDEITVTVSRKNKLIDVKVTLIDSVDNTLSAK